MYTPFDFNEAIGHRKEYIEERLREGSPVVGLAYDGGMMLLTVRRTQRKIYEIYDRQMFSAIGNQSDIEQVRLAAIQRAHKEGFDRSPDDVTLHRLVGFELSPAIKRAFGDQLTSPFVIKSLFAEIGAPGREDVFLVLNFDGEFRQLAGAAAIAGTQVAEDRMMERIGEPSPARSRDAAMRLALSAWIVGAREALRPRGGHKDEDDLDMLLSSDSAVDESAFLRDELKTASVEVGVLERPGGRESRFRLLAPAELDPMLADHA